MSTSARLSISERGEIKRLIESQMEQEIDAAVSSRIRWEEEVVALARKIAIGSLHIEKDLVAIEGIESKIAELEERKAQITRKVQDKLPYADGSKKNRYNDYDDACDAKKGICQSINELTDKAKPAAYAKHPVGKRILSIQEKYKKRMSQLELCSTREDVNARKVLSE